MTVPSECAELTYGLSKQRLDRLYLKLWLERCPIGLKLDAKAH